MTTRKRRESMQRAIVVLEGDKVSTEKTGIAPLWRASKYVSNTDDEILVLTLLSVDRSGPSSSRGFHGDHQCNCTCEEYSYIRYLRQEISQRKEDYRRIFKPFYERCKSNGVKFQVKIAAGCQPMDIITEEESNAGATWIIIDSSFARHLTFRLSGTECAVTLVSDAEETIVQNPLIARDEPESSALMEVTHNPKSPKLIRGSTSREEPSISHWPSTSSEIEQEKMREPLKENETKGNVSTRVSEANFMVEKPEQLSWEVIVQITKRFSTRAWNNQDKNYGTYTGFFENQSVLVKEFAAYSGSILEAEIRAALSMHHKNIMSLTGYHQSENGTILIFPLLQGVTLDRYTWGSGGRELKFQARLKIAMGIAHGVRYMHEECPQGPVVHGALKACNIFLGRDMQPKISSFGKATWLRYEQVSSNSKNRCIVVDPLCHESMALVKSDVLSFGVLLLRLFCRTSAPEDDKSLIEWARPLMLKRKFHELLEEDSDFSDMHGIYRVMAAATACTRTKPISRPYMTQVICLLKAEQFCAMQTSPSDSSM
ncbi:putative proline-rich receptor-like protein kinase PERK11 [Herrania umbratica]|uniref:Proline-rich receptor-like protein kinase PERK11 n=1 Tax=Herrania umbratica TaxID=108875 RepID=A0A6J1A399_9ROSI|nr:putative proline-rich receptor-like protein kinase PERK11 [Herrania umbratica]